MTVATLPWWCSEAHAGRCSRFRPRRRVWNTSAACAPSFLSSPDSERPHTPWSQCSRPAETSSEIHVRTVQHLMMYNDLLGHFKFLNEKTNRMLHICFPFLKTKTEDYLSVSRRRLLPSKHRLKDNLFVQSSREITVTFCCTRKGTNIASSMENLQWRSAPN